MKIRNVMMLIVLAGVFANSPMVLASDAGYKQTHDMTLAKLLWMGSLEL